MAGIGNTVETDLVGETVEVMYSQEYGESYAKRARGRVRAARLTTSGTLCLWLEIVTQEDLRVWYRHPLPAIGDIYIVPTDDGAGQGFLRLVKQP